MEFDVEYSDKIGAALWRMPLGEVMDMRRKVRPENFEKFRDVVRGYIDRRFGHEAGWALEFNGDYTAVRKVTLIKYCR